MARTPKAQALGAMLRQARKDKGIVLDELGAAIHRDIGTISRWENGERTPKPEQVAQILTRLDAHGVRYDEIMTLAYGTNESQWAATTLPELRQQMAAYIDWEQRATRIVEVAPLLVPGLFQINEYIRGIMTAGSVPPDEAASRIATRIGRREVITRKNPPQILVLLGQNVLSQDVGGKQVTIDQAKYLLQVGQYPHVTLRIVPDHRGWHPGLESDFSIIEAPKSTGARRERPRSHADVDSIVFLGARRTVLMFHEEADVANFQWAVGAIMEIALAKEPSLHYIAGLIKRLEQEH